MAAAGFGAVFVLVGLLVQKSASEPLSSTKFPLEWEKYCKNSVSFLDWHPVPPSFNWSQPLIHISCRLTQGSLSLSDFRAWSNATDGRPIALDILCVNQGNSSIRFPWPFKAPHLVSLKIVNCRITDFYSEYLSDTNDTSNPLRLLILENVVSYLTLSHLNERPSYVLELSRDVYCSSESLEKIVLKNFTTHIIKDNPAYVSNETEIRKEWIRQMQDVPHRCDYKYLQYMDESNNNKLNQLHLHFFTLHAQATFPQLLLYNLSHMEYEVVPSKLKLWRYQYPKLSYLDLSWNNISSFDFVDFGETTNGMGEIDLRYNNISQLTSENLEILGYLKTVVVNLRDNPLSCDCFTNEHLFRLLRDNPRLAGVGLGNYEYIRNISCASPERLAGVPFGHVTDEDIFCEEPLPVTFIAVVSSLGFLAILFAVIVCLVFRHRKKLTFVLYTRCGILFGKILEEKKTFDAFISYSSLDDHWVIHTLVKGLESKDKGPAFKLCVHHRDFEVGAAIADNVVKSVESSRHTVLVLSRNFTKSEWCIYEFRTAMHQSLIEKRRHMVIILLEDFPKEELEPDLRKCLETFTYITAGDKLFWDKITYSLSRGAGRVKKNVKAGNAGSHDKAADK